MSTVNYSPINYCENPSCKDPSQQIDYYFRGVVPPHFCSYCHNLGFHAATDFTYPFLEKPTTKIEKCTYNTTKDNFFNQWWYKCRDCYPKGTYLRQGDYIYCAAK